MITIGVTGIMGSGKSFVSGIFGKLGAEVIDADEIVHELMRPGTAVAGEIAKAFGEDVLDGGGAVDRKKLAVKVFLREPGRVSELNSIIHPEVIKAIETRLFLAEKRGVRAVVIDAPLLIETGLNERMNYTVCVRASAEKALERLLREGKADRGDFKARMKHQLDASEKEKFADFVLDNNGAAEKTESQVREIWERITGGKKYEYC